MGEYTILVCDDDKSIVDSLEIYLLQKTIKLLKRITDWKLSWPCPAWKFILSLWML